MNPPPVPPRTFPAPTNLKVLPKEFTGKQVHDIMEQWVGSLGIRCDSCHVEVSESAEPGGRPHLDFADDSKPMKAAARLMYTMTEEINSNYITKVKGSDTRVTCGTCHRGQVSPEPFIVQPAGGPPRVQAARPEEAKPDPGQVMQPPSGILAGAACATCHKEVVKDFANDPHSRPAPMNGKSVTCESCHGPGKAHAENGDVTMIFNPTTAEEVDKQCRACHGSRQTNFEHSAHGVANVSCIGCHTIHAPAAAKHLLRVEQPALCFQCHSDVKPQFSTTPFHHKVEEGLIDCTDCHDAHGATGEGVLPAAKWQSMMCTKCHTATAGPFLYEHAAVTAEGCTACHFSHGGPNRQLLIQANVNTICLQCHLPSANSAADLPPVPAHIQSPQSQSCISCHTNIHGSNSNEFLSSYGSSSVEAREFTFNRCLIQ